MRSACLKTPKRGGEKALTLASKLGLFNRDLEIQRNEEFIYIPLAKHPSTLELNSLKRQVADLDLSTHFFPERKKPAASLSQLLENDLPSELLTSLPRAIDFIGDIAILELPQELDEYKRIVGEAILKANKRVRTVLAKAGIVTGTYRLRDFTVIAGEPKTQTVHKEYGCQYYLDVAKAFFSPRLSFEHHRVASLVKDSETVVDLFAGVGPFSVQIAKNHQSINVYALDMNPNAIEYLKKNIGVNKVAGKVHPILGDARQVVCSRLQGVADRAIMNLPEKAIHYVDVACEAIKPSGGMLHFYSFVNKPVASEDPNALLERAVEKSGRNIQKILLSRLVRETAPFRWQAVSDVIIS